MPLTGYAAAHAISGYMTLGSGDARFNRKSVEDALRNGRTIRLMVRPLRMMNRVTRSPRKMARQRTSRQAIRRSARRKAEPHLAGAD